MCSYYEGKSQGATLITSCLLRCFFQMTLPTRGSPPSCGAITRTPAYINPKPTWVCHRIITYYNMIIDIVRIQWSLKVPILVVAVLFLCFLLAVRLPGHKTGIGWYLKICRGLHTFCRTLASSFNIMSTSCPPRAVVQCPVYGLWVWGCRLLDEPLWLIPLR